jgi:hypothetical protein
LNLYVPIPSAVDPNPTIFDLIVTEFGEVFVYLNETIPLDNDAVNVPMN